MSGIAGGIQLANMGALLSGGSLPVHIAVGATALYDLRSGWDGEGSVEGWTAFQKANARNLPPPGPAFPIIKELSLLNRFAADPNNRPLVRVQLVSQMRFGASRRVIGALKRDFKGDFNTTFQRSSYSGGKSIVPHLLQLGVHLYLAGNAVQAYRVLQGGVAAVHVLASPDYKIKTDLLATPLFLSWDADGTIWDDASEQVFQRGIAEGGMEHGVRVFNEHEEASVNTPNGPGPLFRAFQAFCALRSVFPESDFPVSPFQQGILTARGLGSQDRIHTNLAAFGDLGDYLDATEGLSGEKKGPWIKLHGASLHLDDGAKHNASSVEHGVPAGHVIAGVANQKMIDKLEAIVTPKSANVASKPKPASQRFFWVDFETTGTDGEKDAPLEIAVVVTDGNFNIVERYQRVIYQPPDVLASMSPGAREMHQSSGLLDQVANGILMERVDEEALELGGRYFPAEEKIVLFGNSVGFDQRFVQRCLPRFAQRIHYRVVDVTSWEVPFKQLYGIDLREGEAAHRALADVETSVRRLKKLMEFVKVP